MKDLERMTRLNEIEEQLKTFKELKKEQEVLKRECKHNLVVLTGTYDFYGIDAKCMICGQSFDNKFDLRACGYVIDIKQYYYTFWNITKMEEAIKQIYKEVVLQNKDLEPQEIAKMVEQKFKEKYEPLKELIEKRKKNE